MTGKIIRVVAATVTCLSAGAGAAVAQQAPQAAGGGALPDVEVIQKKAPAAAPAQKKAPVAKKAPAPQPAPAFEPEPVVEQAPVLENSPYGAANSSGAAARAATGPSSPINARQALPDDLQNFTSAGTRVTTEGLEEQRPVTNHEALARVPGVVTVNDDGFGRHGGIGIRGSAPRRSRKVLIMEDGQPINFAPYLDSSSHYTPPTERLESIEVLRGTVLNYGPLNNFGVVNFRNLSPFGENETLIKAGIGYTEGSDKDVNNFRHVHTRQNLGNVGIVASYSGSEAGGAWDNEVLRYNDFYGALGLKGSNQDVTVSGGYHRQRDRYDESNFEGTETDFFANGRNKDGIDDDLVGFDRSSYNGDHYRLQVAHNLYIDPNTTLSTRLYGAYHDRARFYPDDGDTLDELVMEGRDRQYRNVGVDSRAEFANLALAYGIKHDLQVGVGYREEFFTNTNRVGEEGEVLDFDNRGELDERQKLDAQAFTAFVQTAIHVTPWLTVTPGVRFESYDISFRAVTEGFGGGASYDHVLPGVSFAMEAMPRTTLYGGYHQGITPHIIRDANEDQDEFIPPDEEIGDNFQVGVRSTALKGVTVDMAYFYSRIDNYQFGEAFSDPGGGDRVFSALDEVSINGFEIAGRVESQPFTGGPWNFFGEAIYTYADAEIEKGINDDGDSVAGNRVPEAIKHFANLTVGVAQQKWGWDASMTWTYRGDFFTDSSNTPYGGDDEGEQGLVPDIWLLSARTNLKVTEKLSLFATGQNLTDEFYITDRADGIKPGQGRTIMGGFTLKFD